MTEPLLAVEELHTAVPRTGEAGGELSVVRGVSFALQPGEATGLVGESGSGKSLTALSIAGLLPEGVRVAGGSILYRGRELLTMPERSRRSLRGSGIAMVFQDPMTALNPYMRVGSQVAEGLTAHGGTRDAVRRRTFEALTEVGLPRPGLVARAYPHQLSGGQRQRVMIAVALAARPALLIADEPTTAVDVTIQGQLIALIEGLRRRRGLAVLWITHDFGVVARVARRVLVMYAGRIVEGGPVADVFAAPEHPYTAGLLGSIPPPRAAERCELPQIAGAPPDLDMLPAGCSFRPRCTRSIHRCATEDPALTVRDAKERGHEAACWVPREQWGP